MRLPHWFPRLETRSASFTDAIVSALAAAARGGTIKSAAGSGALEAAAGCYSSALQGARVVAPANVASAITPALLGLVGRDLVRRGESLHVLEVADGALQILPVGSWDVRGGPRESSWFYRCDVFGPSGNETRFLPAASVLHFRWAFDAARPYLGKGPLQFATEAGKLIGGLEGSLASESGGPVGHVMPVPDGGEETKIKELRTDLHALAGNMAVVETQGSMTRGRHGNMGGGGATAAEWTPRRFGPSPPGPLVDLYSSTSKAILAACGVPIELIESSAATGGREAWRRFLFGRVAPLAKLLEGEFLAKVGAVTLDFEELRASDLTGRARAYSTLVGASMDPAEARRHTGFPAE